MRSRSRHRTRRCRNGLRDRSRSRSRSSTSRDSFCASASNSRSVSSNVLRRRSRSRSRCPRGRRNSHAERSRRVSRARTRSRSRVRRRTRSRSPKQSARVSRARERERTRSRQRYDRATSKANCNRREPRCPGTPPLPSLPPLPPPAAVEVAKLPSDQPMNAPPRGPSLDSTRYSETSTLAHAIVEAIKATQPIRSHKYFVSNFDPTINNIDAWCDEVDRARDTNGWSDHECLSRVALCLKGDAKTWLSEWVTNDRTWSNFKREFKPLCPGKLDFANILFEAMKTTSDRYPTYAEYARRTLLRLRVVTGLSDELRTLIVIRGIDNPQVRAAAANANLTPETLVSFLSIYAKTKGPKPDTRSQPVAKNRHMQNMSRTRQDVKCFNCGKRGHVKSECRSAAQPAQSTATKANVCAFCKKPGHLESVCFAKDRSEGRNQRNVNLCRERKPREFELNRDIVTAVVEGVPMDVLIDSGAHNVSLISSDILKFLPCKPKSRRCVLRGISEKEILSDSYVTVVVELRDISIEVDLVVVPGSCMETSIIIGTDVLNRDGVTYIRTKDEQFLTHSDKVSVSARVHAVEVESKASLEVNTPLQGEERDELMKVIDDFSDFLITGTAATTVNTGAMEIKLTSSTPVVYRPYRLSHQEKIKVREITNDLLEKGIIRKSQSEYASPIILVKKRDGSDRLCVDFRALNRVTVKERYPLPLIDDHIDRLGSHALFISLDMATGFHQIPIKEESIHLTAFVTPEEHFEYLKMPYGLANSPIVYQRIINDTLRELLNEGNVLVYVDDVLLLCHTVEEGLGLLRRTLETLTTAGFSINLKKCSFLTPEIEYLGTVVSKGQVRPSPRKVEALAKSTPPNSVKQVRQFLGLAGYFRRYIQDYATKTACIAHLTRKDTPFVWGAEQEKVRQDLIQRLTSEPILTIFNPSYPTELHTDASSVGYGAVLLQTHPDGKKHVVAYFSKVTQGAESKYHSYELETLAVVKAVQHFRQYLVGLKFVIITDCNALKSTERKKDLLPRVARWWIYLQDFNFSIEYRKGVMMPHADYLSRNPPASVNQISKPRNWAQIAQAADNETQALLDKLRDGQLDPNRYVAQNDLLYYRYNPVGQQPRLLCYIPKGHRLSLLRVFHDEHEHIGAEKTEDLILKHFWFPGLRHFVRKYIAHCLVCVSHKRVPRAPLQNITSWEKPDIPFHTVHVDTLGVLPQSEGFKFVLVLVDAFSKFCLLYPLYRQDVTELKRVITQAVSLFGVPTLMVTDKGRMFESREFVSLITNLGCQLHYITPEMHQANGQAERYIRTVLNMIRLEANHKKAAWSETLWKLQLVLNITKQKTTQTSALNLLIGTESTTPVIRGLVRDVAVSDTEPNRDALREMSRDRARRLLRDNQSSQDERANRNRRPPHEFHVDDLVFVIKTSQSTGKLDSGMRGPYKVIEVLPSGRYTLKLLAGGYGKTTQAAAQFMVPWKGEWCPESCAAFFCEDDSNDTTEEAPASSGHEGSVASPSDASEPPADAAPAPAAPSSTRGPSSPQVEDDLTSE